MLLSLAALIFPCHPLALINELDKQLFRDNNNLLIVSRSSAQLSAQLISVMR